MNLNFEPVIASLPLLIDGIWVTLTFTLLSGIVGFVWGTVLGLIRISTIKPLIWFATAYISIFRGTPLLVQLFLIYFAAPQLTGYDISALEAGVLAFGLNSAAYIAEIIRGGILAVDKGQREAAMSLGIPYRKMMFAIILPQALKHILPALVNECVALIKESSLVSTIGVMDILRGAQVIQNAHFLAFEPLIIAAVIYYIIVMILTTFAHLLERRLRVSD